MLVRRLELSDVRGVAALHLRAFPGFFLSYLGLRFLRAFYRSFVEDPKGIGIVAVDNADRLLGVVVGPIVPIGYFGRLLKRRWWVFAAASAGAAIRRPTIVPRLVRALTYRGEVPAGGGRALLSSIAVDPAAQGQGVGRTLVLRWLEEMRNRGVRGCYLTTDADNNDEVNAFYQGLGWKVEASFSTPEGRRMNRYIYDFLDIGES